MNKTVEGSIDLKLHVQIDMQELASMDAEQRAKILGWINGAIAGSKPLSLNQLSEVLPQKQLPAPPPKKTYPDHRTATEKAKCRKCGYWYGDKRHITECKTGKILPARDLPDSVKFNEDGSRTVVISGVEGHEHEYKIKPYSGVSPIIVGECWCSTKQAFRNAA